MSKFVVWIRVNFELKFQFQFLRKKNRIKNWNEIIAPGTYESLSLDSKEVAVIKMMTGITANFVISG